MVGTGTRNARAISSGREAREGAEGEGHLRLDGQRGVAAREDQPQTIVGNGVVVGALVVPVHLVLRPPGQLLGVPFQHPVSPQPVDRPVPGHRHDPARGLSGTPSAGQRRSAARYASWTASSASPMLAEDAGEQRDGTPELSTGTPGRLPPPARSRRSRHHHHGPHLDRAVAGRPGSARHAPAPGPASRIRARRTRPAPRASPRTARR